MEFKCSCGCSTFAIPKLLPNNTIEKVCNNENIKGYENVHIYDFSDINKPEYIDLCNGTKLGVKDLRYPRGHYSFRINEPCEFNTLYIKTKYNVVNVMFLIDGECKCKLGGAPV